jgi:transposase
MPAPHPIELRERVVRAYESGGESYENVAKQFDVAVRALQRWVKRFRSTGTCAPSPRGGGNFSQVDVELLEKLLVEGRDRTTHELTVHYNRLVPRRERVHRSSIHRALHRAGYVFKKNSYVRLRETVPTSKKSAERSLDC